MLKMIMIKEPILKRNVSRLILTLVVLYSLFIPAGPAAAEITTCNCYCTAFNGDPDAVETESFSYRPTGDRRVTAYSDDDRARGQSECQSNCEAALGSQPPPTTGRWTSTWSEILECGSLEGVGGPGGPTCSCAARESDVPTPISAVSQSDCCTQCRDMERIGYVQYNSARITCPTGSPGGGAAGISTDSSATVPTFRSPESFGYRNPLGATSIPIVVGRIVRAAVGLTGALFLAAFIWGGVLWMTAGGDTERVKKARTTITNAVIGLLVVGFAYTILSVVISVAGSL